MKIPPRKIQLTFFKFFIIGSILLFSSFSFAEIQLPTGWRDPAATEIKGDDWRNKDRRKYLEVKGDFNGDGVHDIAKIFLKNDGSELGLFVFIAQKDLTFKTYLLTTMNDPAAIHVMGIKKVSPGKYKTACGKGYWACGKDEKPEIRIKNDSIDFFTSESANSYFYWDKKTEAFKNIWISD